MGGGTKKTISNNKSLVDETQIDVKHNVIFHATISPCDSNIYHFTYVCQALLKVERAQV